MTDATNALPDPPQPQATGMSDAAARQLCKTLRTVAAALLLVGGVVGIAVLLAGPEIESTSLFGADRPDWGARILIAGAVGFVVVPSASIIAGIAAVIDLLASRRTV